MGIEPSTPRWVSLSIVALAVAVPSAFYVDARSELRETRSELREEIREMRLEVLDVREAAASSLRDERRARGEEVATLERELDRLRRDAAYDLMQIDAELRAAGIRSPSIPPPISVGDSKPFDRGRTNDDAD